MPPESAWSSLNVQIAVWAVTTALTGLVGFAAAWGALRSTVRLLKTAVDTLQNSFVLLSGDFVKFAAEHQRDIAQVRQERLQCALDSARHNATRGELSRLVADETIQNAEVLKRLDGFAADSRDRADQLHGRITETANRVAALEAVGNQGRGPP